MPLSDSVMSVQCVSSVLSVYELYIQPKTLSSAFCRARYWLASEPSAGKVRRTERESPLRWSARAESEGTEAC